MMDGWIWHRSFRCHHDGSHFPYLHRYGYRHPPGRSALGPLLPIVALYLSLLFCIMLCNTANLAQYSLSSVEFYMFLGTWYVAPAFALSKGSLKQ